MDMLFKIIKKYSPMGIIAVLGLVLLTSCASKNIINDSNVLVEFEKVSALSLQDLDGNVPLKKEDLNALSDMVENDPIANHYMEGLYWFVDHNETEHLGHTLDFLKGYLKTGEKTHCTPHDLWHVALFVKYDEQSLIPHAVEDAKESFPLWKLESEQKRQKFPQFYLRLDEQIAEAEYAIKELQQKNYSDSLMQRIDALGETSSC